jgi:hypothetical protein
MPTLTKEIINAAIHGFEEQRRKLDVQIAELRGMLSGNSSSAATPSAEPKVRKKRGMSAAGRKAIAEAQRKRWAAKKVAEAPTAPAKQAKKKKRKLSAAGRAAIVAALKRRWAAKKAA